MNRPRWHKVLSDLWKNKSRSLLVITSIAVGLFAIGIITKTYFSVSQDMRTGYQAINPFNIQFQTSLIDQDNIDRIERLAGVRQVEAARRISMQAQGKDGAWEAIQVVTRDFEESVINQVEPLAGTWPPQDRQIVLADHNIAKLGIGVGEWITLRNTAGDTFSLKVVGIVSDQTIGAASGGGGYFNAPIRSYTTQDTLEWMGTPSPQLYNELYIILQSDPTVDQNLTDGANSVRQDLEDNGVSIQNLSTRSPLQHPNQELVDAIISILVPLGFLVVFLSAFLITNTLQSLLDQQIMQIGVMKTVGAKRSQIVMIYMALIFIFGLLAFGIAFPLSNVAADTLDQFLATQINFRYSGSHFEPAVLIIQGVLAILIPQIAAFFPIQQGTRISVQEALSGVRKVESTGKSWIDWMLMKILRLSRPLIIAIRNIFRRKGRLILTLITLTLGGAVFISVFNVQISLSKYITQLSRYFLADLNLSLARPYRVDEIRQLLSAFPEIAKVEAWDQVQCFMVLPDGSIGENINLVAVPQDSHLIEPIILEGRWLLAEDDNGIILNDKFQNLYPWIQVGDTITLQIDGEETDWVVAGFFQLAGKIGGLAAYANQDYLATLPGHKLSEASVFRIVAEGHPSSAEQKELAASVQFLLDENNVQVRDLTTGSKLNDSTAEGFLILTNFLLVLAILTALVGSIGLTGTMSMNVMDRTREIGVMRSIGATDSILMKMVLIEGLGIGWISWLLGVLFSFPISKLMSDLVTGALFGAPSDYGFTMTGLIIWFGIVSVLSILASYMPARSATKLTIREVLAYE